MAQVSFVCRRTVISTKPVQPGKFMHLSVLDRIMEPYHVRIVLYYQFPKGMETGERTKKLRESLAEALSSYPKMTGRLVKNGEGHWSIKCNDAGVRMVEAIVEGSMEDWLSNLDREKELKLVHWEDMYYKPYFWSTFYVQVTEFEDGGVAIGLSCSHLLADPTCAVMFIKAWADVTLLGGKMISPPFFHSLPPRRPFNTNINHKPYNHLINNYKASTENSTPTSSSTSTSTSTLTHPWTVTLKFSHEMVQACMAKVDEVEGIGLILTPFEALASLLWVCLSKVKGGKFCGLLDMSLCLDMRKVLGLDMGFFGNCMVYNKVSRDGLEGNEGWILKLAKAGTAIREAVERMDSDGILDLIEWLENEDHVLRATMSARDTDHLICAKLDGVGAYDAIFEDRVKPIHASYYVEPVARHGQVLVLPTPAGDASLSRVVMVTLAQDEVAKLLQDDLLLQFSPSIYPYGI